MLKNSLAFANGKGGVGKTSLTANVSGMAAANGWRVLAVDLDPQGNLGSDLGFKQLSRSDNGSSLLDAVTSQVAVKPMREIRPGLDVVPAGIHTAELLEVLASRSSEGSGLNSVLTALAPLEPEYDLIVFDCPPAGGIMVDVALAAVHYLVIPIRFDDGSIDGIELMAQRFQTVRFSHNPGLELLGVVLFDFSSTGTAIRRDVRSTLHQELGDPGLVFESVIRRSERAAFDMRRGGLLAHEYEAAACEDRRRFSVGERIRAARKGTPLPSFSTAAEGLAEDYLNLSAEILAKIGAPILSDSGGDPWS